LILTFCYEEEFDDTQAVIRIRQSNKDRLYNGQRTNNDLQNITQKTKDRATQTPLKTGVNSGAPKG